VRGYFILVGFDMIRAEVTRAAVGVGFIALAAGLLGCSSDDAPGGSGGTGGMAASTGGAAGHSSGGSALGSGGSALGSGGSAGSSGAGGEGEGGTSMPRDASDEQPDEHVEDAGPPPSSEFVGLYETVIVTNCGGEYCHLAGNHPNSASSIKPALQMPTAAAARAALVNRPLECNPSLDHRIRVVPSDPVASAIMTVTEDGLCGRRHNNLVPSTFGATELGKIEAWIAGGAL
jgi:hypothetical protein